MIPEPVTRTFPTRAPGTAFMQLETALYAALETYSNVHRGTGHASLVSTRLFEHARALLLDLLKLNPREYTVIFCTPERAETLAALLPGGPVTRLASRDLGLPLGVEALIARKASLPQGRPFQSGGGTVQLVSPRWVIWADAPDRFEAGTPAVLNVIAFTRALQLARRHGEGAFAAGENLAAADVLRLDIPLTGRALLEELRAQWIGRDLRVPARSGLRPYTNLDNGASTPTFEPVWRAVCRAWRLPELERPRLVQQVRACMARFLGAPGNSYEVIFTSNTTEAINLAAESLAGEFAGQPITILTSVLEHNSNELPWRGLPDAAVQRLSVDGEGFIDLGELERLLVAHHDAGNHSLRPIRLVAISGASNVLGSFNDLSAAAALAHRYGARLLVDAAQLVAHRRVDMAAEGIDYLAFSAHKAYAPFGSGGLVARRELLSFSSERLDELQSSGEENLVGIAALGMALQLLERIGLDVIEQDERELADYLLDGFQRIPGLKLYGVQSAQSPHRSQRGAVFTFTLSSVPHNIVAQELAEQAAVGVRSGCFCAHLLTKQLLRIAPWRARLADLGFLVLPGFTARVLPGMVRASFGLENDRRDADTLLAALREIACAPRTRLERWLGSAGNACPRHALTVTGADIDRFVEQRVMLVFGE